MTETTERFFIDTNILVYVTDGDLAKSARSRQLLNDGGVLSVQVLNEFTRVARKKLKFSWQEVREFLEPIRARNEIVPLTLEIHLNGLVLAERYQFQIFDAMIVAAALIKDCTTLYSEDMHDGLIIDGLTIRNPYR